MENELVKKIILDTDMGVDCDDAVALAILLNKHIAGEIQIGCITASSTREGATATVQAITNYYGVHLPIGAMASPSLECDKINNYGKAVKDLYGTKDSSQDAVLLLRKTLAQQEGKCTIAAIGPLSNMERLLKSGADEISPLDGEGLVREKVSEIFVMGGSFAQNYDFLNLHEEAAPEWNMDGRFAQDCDFLDLHEWVVPEWNILQDIAAARYFVGHCPVGVTFAPWEAGARVMTKMRRGDNPVWYCMLQYAVSENYPHEPEFERMSWDPVTCLCATDGCEEYFDYSEPGDISVDEAGVTSFAERAGGKHRILLLKEGYTKIAELINASVEPLEAVASKKQRRSRLAVRV